MTTFRYAGALESDRAKSLSLRPLSGQYDGQDSESEGVIRRWAHNFDTTQVNKAGLPFFTRQLILRTHLSKKKEVTLDRNQVETLLKPGHSTFAPSDIFWMSNTHPLPTCIRSETCQPAQECTKTGFRFECSRSRDRYHSPTPSIAGGPTAATIQGFPLVCPRGANLPVA